MVTKNIGDTVSIKPTVKNTGIDAYFDIQYLLNSTMIGTRDQYPMPAGQTGSPGLPFTAQTPGTFDVTVKVLHEDTEMDSKTLPEELTITEAPPPPPCPPPHEAFSVPGVTLYEYTTECKRAVTQTFYPNEQIYARILAGGINQGDTVKWELGWIDAQGGEHMWPESTFNWTVPQQWETIEAAAWWPAEVGTHTWSVWCPYIVKISVNNQLLAKLYFEVVSG